MILAKVNRPSCVNNAAGICGTIAFGSPRSDGARRAAEKRDVLGLCKQTAPRSRIDIVDRLRERPPMAAEIER